MLLLGCFLCLTGHHKEYCHEHAQKQRQYQAVPSQLDGDYDLLSDILKAFLRIILLYGSDDRRIITFFFHVFVSCYHTLIKTEAVDLSCRIAHILGTHPAYKYAGYKAKKHQSYSIIVHIIKRLEHRNGFKNTGKEQTCAQTVKSTAQYYLSIDPALHTFDKLCDILSSLSVFFILFQLSATPFTFFFFFSCIM